MTQRRPGSRERALMQWRAEARNRVVGHLRRVVDPTLSLETAQAMLERARAWSRVGLGQLDRHLAQDRTALTAPSSHGPAALASLLRVLVADGYGDVVPLLGCGECGRTDRTLNSRTETGLSCARCACRSRKRPCARCGQDNVITARRPEGGICRRCYSNDPAVLKTCADCGKHTRPAHRRADGGVLCQTCCPRPQWPCIHCGQRRPAHAMTEDGPTCKRCYRAPPRRCGICGELRWITRRAGEDRPDTCANCYRKEDQCCACGRVRTVTRNHGAFYCSSCYPRPPRQCAGCGDTQPAKANWPIGPVCDTCYAYLVARPRACSRCDRTRVLVGRSPDGHGLCGPCSGIDLLFACRRCDHAGENYSGGLCARCVLTDRVMTLLSDDDGIVPTHLQALADGLLATRTPSAAIAWLRSSPAATLLIDLVTRRVDITHELLDQLPQDHSTRYVRDLLVATNILPRRQEHLASPAVWIRATLAELPAHQRHIVRPFAEWHVLRTARRRARRGPYTAHAGQGDRTTIRTTIGFLNWLDAHDISLQEVDQGHLDRWAEEHRTRIRGLVTFLRWARARGLTGPLDIQSPRSGQPREFLDEHQHYQQLQRCLTDDTLPHEVRIIGALTRLYALPITRIVELTTDRFHRDDQGAYLTLDRNPVLLPPSLAQLIEEQIGQPAPGLFGTAGEHDTHYILPSLRPTRPRSASSTHSLMKQHGLLSRSARNTAMIEAITALPPIVVSDLFGIHPGMAHAWVQYAQDTWADYLAARQTAE